ncbi:MAG: response regulator, partial [Elusimicrobia bacterium]|nr:response regulator [Elusimicrobiota bacterium]
AETDLKRARSTLGELLAHSPAVIYALKIEGDTLVPVLVSDNVERLLGVSVAEASHYQWWEGSLHPEDRERILKCLRDDMLQGRGLSVEYRLRHRDGSYRWVEDNSRVLFGFDGRPHEVIGVWNDITERKSLEDQLRQAQKMEAVGLLAGGVAHDFNNILTGIKGFAGLVREAVGVETGIQSDVDEIIKAADRAASMTRQLLAFSRKQVLVPSVVDLNCLVRNTAMLLERLIEENIKLKLSLEPLPLPIKVDSSQFEQALMNLAVNSRDAMPEGGAITIATRAFEPSVEFLESHRELGPGPHVVISVADTGQGMEPALLPRIFDPFFTTKEKGKGTGLGLSMVYGFVKQSGGDVSVESQPGQGTKFSIYLPTTAEPPEVSLGRRGAENPRWGDETILLIEDDQMVRRLAARILRQAGYHVIEAENAAEGMRLTREATERIHLLLTDVVMPGMSGVELADSIARLSPSIKVLFVSGYAGDSLTRQGMVKPGKPLLSKPFTAETLTSRVRLALDFG